MQVGQATAKALLPFSLYGGSVRHDKLDRQAFELCLLLLLGPIALVLLLRCLPYQISALADHLAAGQLKLDEHGVDR